MKKILITRKLIKSSEEYASKVFDVILNKEDQLLTKDELINKSSDCDGILSSIAEKLDADAISKLSNKVKIISNFAVGYGNIDIEAAKKKNIAVTNTPDVLTDATAEIAMLVLLGAARRAKEGIEWTNKKNWKWAADFLMGKQLTGSRLGILGMGRIGRAVAERAKSFGMKVLATRRLQKIIESKKFVDSLVPMSDIDMIFKESDYISITCPLTPLTRDMMDKKSFKLMKNSAVFINTSRGKIVNESDLIEALEKKEIRGAALDVFASEPLNPKSKLFKLSNGWSI